MFNRIEYIGHGKRTGWCRLCLAEGPLTWDHVPPKGAVEITPVEIDRVASTFSSEAVSQKPAVSQNGLKFRTLCSTCNNKLLGKHCDPALQDLAVSVGSRLTSRLVLPPVMKFPVRPTAIVRAVLGHLVAANTSDHRAGFDDVAYELLCDLKAPIPDNICVSCWVYPFKQAIALRGVAMPTIRGRFKSFSVFHVLKFFPVAFVVTEVQVYEDATPLSPWRELPADEVAEVELRFDRTHHAHWPEAPEDGNVAMFGHQGMESVVAKPKAPRGS